MKIKTLTKRRWSFAAASASGSYSTESKSLFSCLRLMRAHRSLVPGLDVPLISMTSSHRARSTDRMTGWCAVSLRTRISIAVRDANVKTKKIT